MVNASSLRRPSLMVAFSFQMGVIFYNMSKDYPHANESVYQECNNLAETDYSQARACQGETAVLNYEKTSIGLSTREQKVDLGRVIFQTFDTLDLMKDKAQLVMNKIYRPENVSWFLFNVHLTDLTQTCLKGPFERLKGFRDFYRTQQQAIRKG
ncbi:hypothetical protein MTO96_009183 [Rhipicephalus appendiculatus]